MMPAWFRGDGLMKYLPQIFLAFSVSKRRFDVYLIVSKEARAKPAVCSESEAITRRTEVVANCTDKADFPGS